MQLYLHLCTCTKSLKLVYMYIYMIMYSLCAYIPHTCRLYDVPDSELIKHWDKSYRFIKEAK